MKLPMNKSVLIAVSIAALSTLWLASGLFEEKEPVVATSVVEAHPKHTVKVQVSTKEAHNHADVLSIYGQTQADRTVELKTETAGSVIELLLEKGARVKQGDIIARISMDDRMNVLKSAQAAVRYRELEYDASRKLSQKSFRSQTKLAESESLLNAARADLEKARLDIQHTEIKAPFDGILEDTSVEIGDFVDRGDPVAKIVDLSPIIVSGEIPETAISKVKDGQFAKAILSDGRHLEGVIRFVASTSDKNTRTYDIELEADNPDNLIAAGLTAKLVLEVGSENAYLISPAVLTLSDEGSIGIKTVDQTDMVRFHPVRLLQDTEEGLWVSGLPQTARIITRGQEYVKAGQHVIAVEAEQKAVDAEQTTPALAKAEGQ